MGLFSSSRTASSTTNVDETTNNVDYRSGDGSLFGGNVTLNPGDIQGPLTINSTDVGAIRGGVDIALESIDFAKDATRGAYGTARDLFGGAAGLARASQSTVNEALDAGSDALTRALTAGSNALAAVKSVASDSIGQAYGLANQARQSETSGAINNVAKMATIVAGLGILAYAVVAIRKRG